MHQYFIFFHRLLSSTLHVTAGIKFLLGETLLIHSRSYFLQRFQISNLSFSGGFTISTGKKKCNYWFLLGDFKILYISHDLMSKTTKNDSSELRNVIFLS